MGAKHGDIASFIDPEARDLLQSTIPARLAYVWHDGTPPVIPIAFHWNGTELVMATPETAPNMAALVKNAKSFVRLRDPFLGCRAAAYLAADWFSQVDGCC